MRGQDLTKGNIPRQLWTVAWPMMLSMFFHSLYNLVDAFWVAKLSTEAIAAVSVSQITLFIICTIDQASLPDLMAEVLPIRVCHQTGNTYSSESLQQAWADALEQGIDMPSTLWEKLSQLTARVLVESTESSRAGAGE